MAGLIIEGVAGTGKSSTLKALLQNPFFGSRHHDCLLIKEEETFGNLMNELKVQPEATEKHLKRLHDLLPKIEEALAEQRFVVLERFHFSYYALLPHWDLYQRIDEMLARLDFRTVLLDVPDSLIEERSFHRPEIKDWKDENVKWFGSQEEAIKAFQTSQENRRKSLHLSAIPSLKLDTTHKEWSYYSSEILRFLFNL